MSNNVPNKPYQEPSSKAVPIAASTDEPKARGWGWALAAPLTQPHVGLVDKLCDEADKADRREWQRKGSSF